jgi:hypothetical protein
MSESFLALLRTEQRPSNLLIQLSIFNDVKLQRLIANCASLLVSDIDFDLSMLQKNSLA